jgi:hypothetical protein
MEEEINSIASVEARALEITKSVADWPHGAALMYLEAIHSGMVQSKHPFAPTVVALRAGISEALALLRRVSDQEEQRRDN